MQSIAHRLAQEIVVDSNEDPFEAFIKGYRAAADQLKAHAPEVADGSDSYWMQASKWLMRDEGGE